MALVSSGAPLKSHRFSAQTATVRTEGHTCAADQRLSSRPGATALSDLFHASAVLAMVPAQSNDWHWAAALFSCLRVRLVFSANLCLTPTMPTVADCDVQSAAASGGCDGLVFLNVVERALLRRSSVLSGFRPHDNVMLRLGEGTLQPPFEPTTDRREKIATVNRSSVQGK